MAEVTGETVVAALPPRTPLSNFSLRTNLLKFRAESFKRLTSPSRDNVCTDEGSPKKSDLVMMPEQKRETKRRRLFEIPMKGTSPKSLVVAQMDSSSSDEELSPLTLRIGPRALALSAMSFTERDWARASRSELWKNSKRGRLSESPNENGSIEPPAKRSCWNASETSSDGNSSDEENRKRKVKDRRSTEDFVTLPKRPRKRTKPSTAWLEESDEFVEKEKEGLPSIVLTNVKQCDQEAIYGIVKALGKFRVEKEVSEGTTHVISGEKLRTLNMLLAMAQGCWILSINWVYRSLESGRWVEEEPFELTSYFPAVRMSRLEKMEARRDPLRSEGGLLSSVGSIYVSIKSVPAPEKLKLLINLAGGKGHPHNRR